MAGDCGGRWVQSGAFVTALERAAQHGPITHYVRYLEPKERGLADLQEELPCSGQAQAELAARTARASGKRDVRVLTKAERNRSAGDCAEREP